MKRLTPAVLALLVFFGVHPLRSSGKAAAQRPELTGLASIYALAAGAVRDTNGDGLADAVVARVVLPAEPAVEDVQAAANIAGRLAFDYLCLLFALRATGSHPRPSLILVAYAVAGIIGMIPLTPGGLGLVEASLTGLLVLAEVNSSQAVLATLTYRIASYWLPLLAGPVAYGLFRLRSRPPELSRAARSEPG